MRKQTDTFAKRLANRTDGMGIFAIAHDYPRAMLWDFLKDYWRVGCSNSYAITFHKEVRECAHKCGKKWWMEVRLGLIE